MKFLKFLLRITLTSGLLVAVSFGGFAQSQNTSLEERANDAFSHSNWPVAFSLYKEMSQAKPDDAIIWFRLGLSALNANQSPEIAIAAYEKSIDLGAPPGPSLFGIARSEAINANETGVLKALGRLAENGASLGVVRRIEGEPAFDFLRTKGTFSAMVKRLTPCMSDEYRQFDFWLGTWEVTSPQGALLGRNTITPALDGCMLIENWESTGGFRGLSINYYNNSDGTWNQTFRDNTGNVSGWPDLSGGLKDGMMVLETHNDPDNRSRWTWKELSPGKVRQMAESSVDGGKTWTVGWDSIYTKLNGPGD